MAGRETEPSKSKKTQIWPWKMTWKLERWAYLFTRTSSKYAQLFYWVPIYNLWPFFYWVVFKKSIYFRFWALFVIFLVDIFFLFESHLIFFFFIFEGNSHGCTVVSRCKPFESKRLDVLTYSFSGNHLYVLLLIKCLLMLVRSETIYIYKFKN